MNYLNIKGDEFTNYYNKYNTERVFKNLKLHTFSLGILLSYITKLNGKEPIEHFNKPKETVYEISTPEHIIITFLNVSGIKYRLDIEILLEHDSICNHISFGEYYETGVELPRGEKIELTNRIHFILKDLLAKKYISNNFCIGISNCLKNKNYEYILDELDSINLEKKPTELYDIKFGLYFNMKNILV